MGVATMPAPQADDALLGYDLSITRRTSPRCETLILGGEIDLGSAPALEQALRDAERAKPRRIVLDLAALSFLDSTAIHLLIEAQQRAEVNGHDLILTNVPAYAQRLFALTGIRPRLTIQ
jgi:anti-sigma B factor antagonist